MEEICSIEWKRAATGLVLRLCAFLWASLVTVADVHPIGSPAYIAPYILRWAPEPAVPSRWFPVHGALPKSVRYTNIYAAREEIVSLCSCLQPLEFQRRWDGPGTDAFPTYLPNRSLNAAPSLLCCGVA
jgi:hypothetical protein